MKQVRLYKGRDCWQADYTGSDDENSIRELFGTADLPTGFMPESRAVDVQAIIAARHPGYRVTVEV